MDTQRIATIEPSDRIQLPHEWVESLGLEDVATLEKTDSGILVSSPAPLKRMTWEAIFAKKLPIGSDALANEELEVRGDDLLF